MTDTKADTDSYIDADEICQAEPIRITPFRRLSVTSDCRGHSQSLHPVLETEEFDDEQPSTSSAQAIIDRGRRARHSSTSALPKNLPPKRLDAAERRRSSVCCPEDASRERRAKDPQKSANNIGRPSRSQSLTGRRRNSTKLNIRDLKGPAITPRLRYTNEKHSSKPKHHMKVHCTIL